MTWIPNGASEPRDLDRIANRILRLLEQEESEAEELRRLQAEGWRPPPQGQLEGRDARPRLGDERDALADLVGAEVERREAMLAEARRRVAERSRRRQSTPEPAEGIGHGGAPLAAKDLGPGRHLQAGLLGHDQKVVPSDDTFRRPPGASAPSLLPTDRVDAHFLPVTYQPPPRPGSERFGQGESIGGRAFGNGPGGITPASVRVAWEFLRSLLPLLNFGAAVEAEQQRRKQGHKGRAPSIPLFDSPPPPPPPEDEGRARTLPTTPPGTMYGFPGSPPEPPETPGREPERPESSQPHAYPVVVDWIEQDGLFLQNSKGDSQTQADNNYLIDLIVKGLEARGVKAKHAYGGTESERYLRNLETGRTGSARTDGGIRFGEDAEDGVEDTGRNWDFNTVDTLKDRKTPDARERRAIEKIQRLNESYTKARLKYFDAFPKSRGWLQAEWRRRMAEHIDELLDARFGPARE